MTAALKVHAVCHCGGWAVPSHACCGRGPGVPMSSDEREVACGTCARVIAAQKRRELEAGR